MAVPPPLIWSERYEERRGSFQIIFNLLTSSSDRVYSLSHLTLCTQKMKETFTSGILPLHNSALTLFSLCDMTVYLTVETRCSTRADAVHYIIHMDPAEGCGLQGVIIKTGWHSSLSAADIHKICRERGRERCNHIVAMVPRVWKNSRVSMTLPRRLGWLDETSQASWCISPLLFFFLHLSALLPLLPTQSFPSQAPFQACPQFSSLVFCPNEVLFSLLPSIRSSKSTRPPPHLPLRTNWTL